MKFNANSSELSKKLSVAAIAISPKSIMPILEDFLLTLEGNLLTINATNLEISVSLGLEVTGHENGKIAVSSKILLDTLRSLPEQPVTIELTENNIIQLTSSFGQYKMASDDADDFPTVEDAPDSESVTVSSSVLRQAIDNTIIAIGEAGVVRPAMTGVHFQFDFNKANFVSTDSHVLVKYTIAGQNFETTKTFTLPQKGLQLLKNALIDENDVQILWSDKKVFFSFDNYLISTTIINDDFPNFNNVIPVDHDSVMYINRKDLLNSLKRLIIFASKSFNLVTFNISDDSLTLASEDPELSHDATEQLPCKYEGEPVTLGFSAKFFIELLSILDYEEVKIEMKGPKFPVLIKPLDPVDDEDITLLIMPLILKK